MQSINYAKNTDKNQQPAMTAYKSLKISRNSLMYKKDHF